MTFYRDLNMEKFVLIVKSLTALNAQHLGPKDVTFAWRAHTGIKN